MGQERESALSLFLYRAFKWSSLVPFFNFYLKGRIYGLEKVPKQGRVIIVSNHASNFDPPLLASSLCRPIAYMAKQELFDVPVLKQAITAYGAYPVKRGTGDRQAIRSALARLDEGWAVGLFLNGTRTPDGRVVDPKLGAAMIAAKGNAPLLPVCLWGTDKIMTNGSKIPQSVPVTIRVGELIAPPSSSSREELQEVTDQCAKAINTLHDLGR